MAEKKKRKSLSEWPPFRFILTAASAILATLVLAFSALTFLEVMNNGYETAPYYLIWVFVFLGLTGIIVFLKDRTKINLIRCIIILAFNVTLGIIVLFAKSNPYLFSLTAGLYCVVIVISRVLDMIQKRNVRNIILNGLIIALVIAMCVGLLTGPASNDEQIQSIILVECVFVSVVSFIEAASIAFAQLKVKVLFKIVVSTFSFEVLLGLLTMVVCFSLIFMRIEPNMPTFADALWYCFATVTTIGFGDITATTGLGKILTVILGIYGIIVVAVITSIVVNFYNETSGKHDQKELKEISDEEKEKENKKK